MKDSNLLNYLEGKVANHFLRRKLERLNPELKRVKDKLILPHLNLNYDLCTYALWQKDDLFDVKDLDKVLLEYYTKPNTAPTPEKLVHVLNIIPNAALAESAKHWTAEGVLTATHFGIGSGTATPTAGDTALQTQIVRKSIVSFGSRKVTAQTGNYAMLFGDTDASPPYDIREAGLFSAASGGTMYTRSLTTPFTITAGLFWSGKIAVTYTSV